MFRVSLNPKDLNPEYIFFCAASHRPAKARDPMHCKKVLGNRGLLIISPDLKIFKAPTALHEIFLLQYIVICRDNPTIRGRSMSI